MLLSFIIEKRPAIVRQWMSHFTSKVKLGYIRSYFPFYCSGGIQLQLCEIACEGALLVPNKNIKKKKTSDIQASAIQLTYM